MDIGRVDHFARSDPYLGLSPTTVAHLSQKRLMPLLLDEALAAGCEVSGRESGGNWPVWGVHG